MLLNTFDGFYGYSDNAEAEFEKNPCSLDIKPEQTQPQRLLFSPHDRTIYVNRYISLRSAKSNIFFAFSPHLSRLPIHDPPLLEP